MFKSFVQLSWPTCLKQNVMEQHGYVVCHSVGNMDMLYAILLAKLLKHGSYELGSIIWNLRFRYAKSGEQHLKW